MPPKEIYLQLIVKSGRTTSGTKKTQKPYILIPPNNLVAVISNGTAVLGLGDIGPQTSKPVMEGRDSSLKSMPIWMFSILEWILKMWMNLFKTVKNIAPTFGGINLEDIKAPECLKYRERDSKKELNIPVMHDDQHGTAMISALRDCFNATRKLLVKRLKDIKIVVNGAGAAAISCCRTL